VHKRKTRKINKQNKYNLIEIVFTLYEYSYIIKQKGENPKGKMIEQTMHIFPSNSVNNKLHKLK